MLEESKDYKIVKFANGTYAIKNKKNDKYVGVKSSMPYQYYWSEVIPNHVIEYCQDSYDNILVHFNILVQRKKNVELELAKANFDIKEVNEDNIKKLTRKQKRHLKNTKHLADIATSQEVRFQLCRAEDKIIRLQNENDILQKKIQKLEFDEKK